MSTVYMFSIIIYNYKLNKSSKVVLILNLSYIGICLLIDKNINIVNIGNILDLISAIFILGNIYIVYIKESKFKKYENY